MALLVAGCGGSAKIRFVSLHLTEIDPPATTVWEYHAQACYWWLDDAGDLNVAMKCRQRNLLMGRYGRVDLDMSFALDKPPAGSGRNYPVRRRETRTLLVTVIQDVRMISQMGIVAVMVQEDGTLRGSFRIRMKPRTGIQLFSFLPRRQGPLLCFGTFHAVRDAERGKAIRARCESGGWTRPPRKKTRTATRPAATGPSPKRHVPVAISSCAVAGRVCDR